MTTPPYQRFINIIITLISLLKKTIKVSAVYEAAQGDPYCEFVWNPLHFSVCSCVQNDEEQRRGMCQLPLY